MEITTKSYNGENPGDDGTVLTSMPVSHAVSMNAPPADDYLTHLPKHPGCKACMNCRVQRKLCRDVGKGRKKNMVNTTDTEWLGDHEIEEKLVAPKVSGDLATSDSIFAIKRNSASPARANDTTALVIKGKGT